MDDAGGNSDEQIPSAGAEIRGVEQRIREVEQQIGKLEQKIDNVEEQIGTCSSPHEKAQLRDEKAQLRGKEAQLRGKEDRLRDEKAQLLQLLQGRETCTEFDWLCQFLPPWDSRSLSMTPSSTRKERMYTPVKVEYWDVAKDIEDYVSKADKLKRGYRKVDNRPLTGKERNSKQIAGVVMSYVCDHLNKKRSGSSVEFALEASLKVPPGPVAERGNSTNPDGSKAEDSDNQKCRFYARDPRVDIVVRSDGNDAAVLELKNGGLGCPVPMCELWARCSCLAGIDLNCWCNSKILEGQAGSILNCVLQLYEYMVLAKVGYGALTDTQNWYLFRRDHGGYLYISTCFKWDDRQPPLLAAVAYLVNSAVDTFGEFDVPPRTGERPWSWEATPSTSPSGDSKDDQDKDSSYKPNKQKTGGHRTSPARTRWACSNTRQNELQEIRAADLHLDDRAISSGGWSGCVVGGILNGRRVAVKLAPRDSERAEALLNEVSAYGKLQKYWGEFVPSLVGCGTTVDGQIIFIATEFIDGCPLGSGTVTEEVATAARQALGAVHACKVLHGDVEARNIMVVESKQPSVRLIDFGFAQRSSNWRSQQAELKKLDSVLKDMMGVGVGKEFGVRYPHEQLCLV